MIAWICPLEFSIHRILERVERCYKEFRNCTFLKSQNNFLPPKLQNHVFVLKLQIHVFPQNRIIFLPKLINRVFPQNRKNMFSHQNCKIVFTHQNRKIVLSSQTVYCDWWGQYVGKDESEWLENVSGGPKKNVVITTILSTLQLDIF